jgi:hypothetical protein
MHHKPAQKGRADQERDMARLVNAGARLDRLPISSFHKRIFFLIGAGMFFDGYDLYLGTNVLGAVLQSKFATLEQVPQFISLTFLGLTIGSFITGFIGDPASTEATDAKLDEQLLLDGDALAKGKGFLRLGSTRHSPDHRLLAWLADEAGRTRAV